MKELGQIFVMQLSEETLIDCTFVKCFQQHVYKSVLKEQKLLLSQGENSLLQPSEQAWSHTHDKKIC